VQFKDPDPRCILLNGVRLDEHLRRSGEKPALKVRQLLQGQSWLEFEADYRPGGRRRTKSAQGRRIKCYAEDAAKE